MFAMYTTTYLAISQVALEPGSTEVGFFGLWYNIISGKMEDAYFQCTFRLFYDLLSTLPGEGDLALDIADKVEKGGVLDLTATGGLQLDHLFLSLEPVTLHPNPLGLPEESELYLRGFIHPNLPLPPLNNQPPTAAHLLTVLALCYQLYLQLREKHYTEPLAAYYAGLQNPVVMALAEQQYEQASL